MPHSPHRAAIFALRQRDETPQSSDSSGAARSRVLQVAGAMFVSNGLTILLQIIMVPVLIWAWGATLYGEWLILYTIPGYLSLSDFGIIASANNKIEAHCARRYFVAANRTYFNSIIVLAGIIALVATVGTAVWIILGENFAALFVTLKYTDVLQIVTILFVDSMLTLVLNHHSALYRTLGKFSWTVNWQAIGRVIPIFGLCLAAAFGATLLVAALTMLCLRLVLLAAMAYHLRQRIIWMRRDWLRGSQQELGQLLRGALGFMTLPLSNMIYLHVTTLVVAAITTPATVATFSTMRTFTRMIPQFVAIAGRARWSEIAKANARGNQDLISEMQTSVLKQTAALTVIAAIGYLIFGKMFYEFWTGGKLEFDWFLFLALLANAIMIAGYYSLEVFLLATNQVRGYASLFLTVTLLQIFAGFVLSKFIGIVAFPAAATFGAFGILFYLVRRTFALRKDAGIM